jgi:hypothetical protein
MPVLCFFLGRRFRTTVSFWLLVTLFPLGDGGVGLLLWLPVRCWEVVDIIWQCQRWVWPTSWLSLIFFRHCWFSLLSACLNNACEAFDCLDVQIGGKAVNKCLSTYSYFVSVVLQFLPGICIQPFLGLCRYQTCFCVVSGFGERWNEAGACVIVDRSAWVCSLWFGSCVCTIFYLHDCVSSLDNPYFHVWFFHTE